MRTLSLFAGFVLALSLTACDTTGIDIDGGGSGGDCHGYHCDGGGDNGGGDNGGGDNGGGDNGGGDNGGGDNGDNGGGDNGDNGGGGTDATLDISPFQTYLRTSEDKAIDSPAVSLTDLGYVPGDPICFRAVGDFSLVENYWASERGEGFLTAVFSSSDHLRDNSELNRVTGAIDAGDDVFTLDTAQNGLQTDIDEDFSADDVCLTIPAGAEFVFFAAYDSFYADNDNIDGTPFQVSIRK